MNALIKLQIDADDSEYCLTGTFRKEYETQYQGDEYSEYYDRTLAKLPSYSRIRLLAERYEQACKTAKLIDTVEMNASVPLVESFAKMRNV